MERANFYPKRSKKYLCFSNFAEAEGLSYDFYPEVLELLKPKLQEREIGFVQLIYGNSSKIAGETIKVSDYKHLKYLIANSQAFLGNDSFMLSIAEEYNVPMTSVYGPTRSRLASLNAKAYLENPVISHCDGKIPSFNPSEKIKTINLIHPEEVAQAVLKSLDPCAFIEEKTVHIGQFYHNALIEIVPDHLAQLKYDPKFCFNLRCDWHFEEKFLIANLQNLQSSWVFADKFIEPALLVNFRSKINKLVVFVDEFEDEDWINLLTANGVKLQLVSRKKDSNKDLFDLKLRWFEKFHIAQEILGEKIEEIKEGDKFRSKRLILSSQGLHLTQHHWQEGIASPDREFGVVSKKDLDSEVFWHDSSFLWFTTHPSNESE